MASIINAATSGGLVTTADTSGVLQLQTASTTAVTVDASQNVGIGTTSPGARLDVRANVSTSYAGGIINSNATGQGLTVRGGSTSSEDTFNCLTYDGNLALFTVLGNGNVVIPTGTLKTVSTISVGNATPSASGAGITFPATQSASSNANTLDDYEEGTWTPVIVGGTTAGTGTYGSQVGRYTKIGNTVRIYFAVAWSAHTGTGITIVTGFPFSSNDGGQTPFAVFTYGETFTANNVANGGIMSNGTTQWLHYQVPVGGGNSSGIPIYNGTSEIQLSGVYQTA